MDYGGRRKRESMKAIAGNVTAITKTKDFKDLTGENIPMDVFVDRAMTGLDINPANLGTNANRKYVSIDNSLGNNDIGTFIACFLNFVDDANLRYKTQVQTNATRVIRLNVDAFFERMKERIPALKLAQAEAFATQDILLQKQIKKINTSLDLTSKAKEVLIDDLRLQLEKAKEKHKENLKHFEALANNQEAINLIKIHAGKCGVGALFNFDPARSIQQIVAKASTRVTYNDPELNHLQNALLGKPIRKESVDSLSKEDHKNLELISKYAHLIRGNFMTKSDELQKISIIGIESISSEDIAAKLKDLRTLTKNHIEKMSKDTSLTSEKRQKLEAIKTRVEALDDESLDPKQQAMNDCWREHMNKTIGDLNQKENRTNAQ
jgi:hypothetical protein